jgi:signal transduction histidine kinase/DNA-binding response OmpR family regulator/large-conductance mechanosensitive channel
MVRGDQFVKKIGDLIHQCYQYFFIKKIPPDIRIINTAGLIGMSLAFLGLIIYIIINSVFSVPLAALGLIVVLIILLVIGNRFRDYPLAYWVVLIIIGDILFPLGFLSLHGGGGGLTVFFVVYPLTVFFLMREKPFIVLLTLHILVIVLTYCIGCRSPSQLSPVIPYQQFLNNILSILMTGLCIGFTVKFQNRIDMVEKDKFDQFSNELVKQDRLLRAVNDSAAILLTADANKFETALQISMEMLAGCVDVDHVYIWKDHQEKDNLYYIQSAVWERDNNNELISKFSFSYNGLPLWEDKLLNGECINGPIHNLPPDEYSRLEPYGIKSILVIPVFLQERFWGFVSFDDCRNEREFSAAEENIMCSGSLLMVNAVVRNEMTASLIKAREEALSSTKAKSDFLANMSHEMRTPMNAITGMTMIAKSSNDIERKNYCLNKIENASSHLLGVINDILDMSKIEANKFELSPVSFNFEKMLQKVVNVINFRIDEKHQYFYVRIDRNIPRFLNGDDQRLAQVITNLLSNAVKFTPEQGTLRLNSKLVEEVDGLCTIQVKVSDTGIGITKEQQERLFNSFEQAESGTARKFGGTGLGLAISKRIVNMMDGHIWVESEPGKGSDFIFTVKLNRDKDEQRDFLQHSGTNWNNLRTMAVDDEPETLAYFELIAEQFGFSCRTVSSGEDALEINKKEGPYDIYFVDWKMPGMNGIELSRRIKEQGPGNAIVIMISAAEWMSVEEEAKQAGVDKFLSKPLFPSAIADCINECIGMPPFDAENNIPQAHDNFDGFRILLVEDIEINREIVLSLLEPAGLKIDCAENGVRAVEMYTAAPEIYDIIFMDVQMPEMDGYEATRQIRVFEDSLKDKPNPDSKFPLGIPIIAMTANVFKEDIQHSRDAGMDDHLGKPLDMENVLSILRKYLPRKQV